ncbi:MULTISPECIES: histidine phosphatase family protein [Streptomyces]|uniref:Phosphatase n=1 Tax=Streptomyces virginiae TaxID=1961 RepID=A0ABQ3NL82_STRVG|nr:MULTISPECIES: histidine phosphatase family protein [Streptomyces]MBP2342576.1 putative phosphoglycerate mutase [Streptomyces virginiae]MCI4080022.1 histidine phosphatase family protein [Streptomyces sp. MMS21 TC-5]QNE28678.1 histidine phosphatase family protein [Streptomyces sp. INR7]RST16007.1 histidine phosphatase family protein [Streptomyces sp. WAC05950]GGQ20357.1 phosphatase [Streptomyces virginiae]
MSDLLLVRHGETAWSANGRHTGRTDVPLTARGVEEAISLAPYFQGRRPALVLTSPLRRAVATAELAGLPGAGIDSDLYEWDYGGYEGITTVEIHRTTPDWSLWTHGVPPGDADHPGESAAQVGARADRVLARVAPVLRADDGDVVLVAHGHFLRVLTARYLRLEPEHGRLFLLRTGTVSTLSTEHGLPVIAGWNTRP